jgi:hypothetical protein
MAKYTFDDFMKAMQDNNLTENFSDADIRLAQKNPDAGMSILNYKLDVRNAKTPEEKALANAGAEQIRSSYGGYTAGSRGEGFYLDPLSPGSFDFGSAPTYENRYDEQLQDMLDKLLNREDFTYDPETDQLYSQYKKQYNREGDRATAEALGAAAAASGGIPSSYAATAAAQAGNYFASQLTDKIPDLYELAYNKYLSDYNMDLTDLDAVRAAEASDYEKYLTDLSQWNADREFEYGKLLDEINSQTMERQEAIDRANMAAEYGDFSLLEGLGIDTSRNPMDWEREYNKAILAAEYGDYSGLEKLGIKPNVSTYSATSRSTSGKSTSSGSGKSTSGQTQTKTATLTQSDVQKIKNAYGNQLTQSQWDALKSANQGLTDEALLNAGFTIKSESKTQTQKNTGNNANTESQSQIDMQSVIDLGYGPISAKTLDELVRSGKVEEYEENGVIKFRKR